MERKDEGISVIFMGDALIHDINLESEECIVHHENGKVSHKPFLNTYTISFTSPDRIIFENPIKINKGPYEVLIMIREKQ